MSQVGKTIDLRRSISSGLCHKEKWTAKQNKIKY